MTASRAEFLENCYFKSGAYVTLLAVIYLKILPKVKRGRTKMVTLDATVKYLKTSITRYLQLNPKSNFARVLKEGITAYNNKYNDKIGGSPSSLNSDYFGKTNFFHFLVKNF